MKLFKKVMASVLAGVLALSMVACSTTNVIPGTEIPTPAPTSSDADAILSYINYGRNDIGAPALEQDAKLQAKAQAVLDFIADCDNSKTVNENGDRIVQWVNADNTSLYVDVLALNQKLTELDLRFDGETVMKLNGDMKTKVPGKNDTNGKFGMGPNFMFENSYEQAGSLAGAGIITTGIKKIGVATKVVRGKTLTLILVK